MKNPHQIPYYIPVTVKRNLSVATSFAYDIPIETQIPLVSKAGFNYFSLGGSRKHMDIFSKEARQKLLGLMARYALKMDTIHGPLSGALDMREIENMAAAARDFNAPVVVLHCSPFEIPESELASRFLRLKKDVRDISKIAQETGISFALENMVPGPATELVRQTLLNTDYPRIGFCYDSSHDQIDGPRPFTLLEELKDRLITVHLSDRIKPFTDHVIPGEGFIHWDELYPILKQANVKFPLLFEIATTYSAEKDSEKFLKLAYERGCKVWDRVVG